MPSELGALLRMIMRKRLVENQAKEVLGEMFRTGKSAALMVKSTAWPRESDARDEALSMRSAANPQQLTGYVGKEELFGSLWARS